MPKTHSKAVPSPVGPLTLFGDDTALTQIRFGAYETEEIPYPLLNDAAGQLEEYFSGTRRVFSVPIRMEGTPFQHAVWEALTGIPYGQTASYGDIARRIGRPKACRAVGMAVHVNPLPIIVPCHRIIGSNGSLTGYAPGVDKKIILLKLEGIL